MIAILERVTSNMSRRRTLVLLGAFVVWLIFGWQLLQLYSEISSAGFLVDDFVAFWSAGHLTIQNENPYGVQELLRVQQSVGSLHDGVLAVWNPPWSLPLFMVFGLFNYPVARLLWLLSMGIIIFYCADWLWRYYGGTQRRRGVAWLVAILFPPSIWVLRIGNITPLVLLGIVAFLKYERRRKWWLAGASLILIAIKPHIVYLFGIALLLWMYDQRRWTVAIGSGVTALVAVAIPFATNSAVLSQYLYATANQPPFYWATPTWGAILRLIFGLELTWLQFVPSMFGIAWLLYHWRKHRHDWDWGEQTPLLLLVSLVTSTYGWAFDQVILVPMVVQLTVDIVEHRSLRRSVTVVYLIICGLAVALHDILRLTEFWLLWLAPVFLIGYLIARQQLQRQQADVGTTGVAHLTGVS